MKFFKVAILSVLLLVSWIAVALALAFRGWWMEPVAAPENQAAFYAWAVNQIETSNLGSTAFVLIEEGAVADTFYSEDVNQDTLFPTASLSKWISALAIMVLAERELIDLDTPVSGILTRWQLPDSEFDLSGVTVRRLLSHTAGLTDGLGFGDYGPDEELPSLEESLRSARTSDGTVASITVGVQPGSEFQYSGGGYLILQLLAEEATGQSFADFVQSSVFDELGMHRSTYAYLGSHENIARSFNTDGSVAPLYRYASDAATGLSSSAGDLVKLVQMYLGDHDAIIHPTTVASMREPHADVLGASVWGLGTMLYAPLKKDDFVYGHDGANDPAINSAVRMNPATRDGIIMLVSGHRTLASSVASEWVLWQTGQPDFLSTDRAMRSALIPVCAGALLVLIAGYWMYAADRK